MQIWQHIFVTYHAINVKEDDSGVLYTQPLFLCTQQGMGLRRLVLLLWLISSQGVALLSRMSVLIIAGDVAVTYSSIMSDIGSFSAAMVCDNLIRQFFYLLLGREWAQSVFASTASHQGDCCSLWCDFQLSLGTCVCLETTMAHPISPSPWSPLFDWHHAITNAKS